MKKFQSQNYLKKTCLATNKRYVDDIFLYTILKLKIFFALMTSYIIIHDVIFMMTFHNMTVFQRVRVSKDPP